MHLVAFDLSLESGIKTLVGSDFGTFPNNFSDPCLWYHLLDCFLIFALKKGERRSQEGNFVSHLGSRRFEQSCFLFTVGTVALRLDLLEDVLDDEWVDVLGDLVEE